MPLLLQLAALRARKPLLLLLNPQKGAGQVGWGLLYEHER